MKKVCRPRKHDLPVSSGPLALLWVPRSSHSVWFDLNTMFTDIRYVLNNAASPNIQRVTAHNRTVRSWRPLADQRRETDRGYSSIRAESEGLPSQTNKNITFIYKCFSLMTGPHPESTARKPSNGVRVSTRRSSTELDHVSVVKVQWALTCQSEHTSIHTWTTHEEYIRGRACSRLGGSEWLSEIVSVFTSAQEKQEEFDIYASSAIEKVLSLFWPIFHQ